MPPLRKINNLRTWLYGLVAGVITGAASAALSAFGISAGAAAGADVRPLDYKQVGAMFLAGGFISALAYLKQSPLPKTDDDEAQ